MRIAAAAPRTGWAVLPGYGAVPLVIDFTYDPTDRLAQAGSTPYSDTTGI